MLRVTSSNRERAVGGRAHEGFEGRAMCFVFVLLLFSPRIAALFWWLIDSDRWENAFSSVAWPILGILFLPWTTIMFVSVAPFGNVSGTDWIFLTFGLLFDLLSYGGGGYRRRF
jgi:hypothetical protein